MSDSSSESTPGARGWGHKGPLSVATVREDVQVQLLTDKENYHPVAAEATGSDASEWCPEWGLSPSGGDRSRTNLPLQMQRLSGTAVARSERSTTRRRVCDGNATRQPAGRETGGPETVRTIVPVRNLVGQP
jgi:hypothetical protein